LVDLTFGAFLTTTALSLIIPFAGVLFMVYRGGRVGASLPTGRSGRGRYGAGEYRVRSRPDDGGGLRRRVGVKAGFARVLAAQLALKPCAIPPNPRPRLDDLSPGHPRPVRPRPPRAPNACSPPTSLGG
jgi:hypothetical protein